MINESNNSDPSIISTSNEFSDTSKILLEKKISFLGLDNVVLIEGPFSKTMVQSNNNSPGKLLAGIVDCDLYESYKTSLKFFWPKLIKSGALYIDEYFSLKYPGARIAVNEFLETHDGMLKKHQNDSFEFERWMLFKS